MNAHPLSSRPAGCSWPLQPSGPQELVAATQATGVQRVQLALDPLRESPSVWGRTQELSHDAGVAIEEVVAGKPVGTYVGKVLPDERRAP